MNKQKPNPWKVRAVRFPAELWRGTVKAAKKNSWSASEFVRIAVLEKLRTKEEEA